MLKIRENDVRLLYIIDKHWQEDGGAGSGNWGHKGRPGKRGGSGAGGGKKYRSQKEDGTYTAKQLDPIEATKKYQNSGSTAFQRGSGQKFTPSAKASADKPQKLTEGEKSALEHYVSGEGMWINQLLRGRMDGESVDTLSKNEKSFLEDLSKAADRKIEAPEKLYRSVDASAIFGDSMNSMEFENLRGALVYGFKDKFSAKALENAQKAIGTTKTDEGFMSTTSDPDVAHGWGDFTGSDFPVVLELETNGTVNGVDIAAEGLENEDDPQKEILLNRGQSYEITGLKAENGSIVVQARIIYSENVASEATPNVLNESQNGDRIDSDTAFLSKSDPLRDVIGSIKDTHPEEIKRIRNRALELGVEIIEGRGNMAYAPGLVKGTPGQLHLSEDDSLGAWLHESKHMEDDAKDGFPGFSGMYDSKRRVKMETEAYNIEIQLAEKLGYHDVADTLRGNLREEITRIGGGEDS